MNKMKRPVAIMMTLVMLLGTVLIYAPAYALPVTEHEHIQIEEDNIIPALRSNYGGEYFFVLENPYWTQPDIYWYNSEMYYYIEDVSDLPGGFTYTLIATEGYILDPATDIVDPEVSYKVPLKVYDNRVPLAVDDGSSSAPFVTILEDANTINLDVLANDTDLDDDDDFVVDEGDVLTITRLISAADGMMDSPGDIEYTPPENFNGWAIAQYEIMDDAIANPETAKAMVFVYVTPVNDPPEWMDPLVPEKLIVDEGGTAQFDWRLLVMDVENNPLTLIGEPIASVGYFVGNGDGFTYTYIHDGSEPNPSGMDGTIQFTVSDGDLETLFIYEILVNEIPDSEIGITLGNITSVIPNHHMIDGIFVQQGDLVNLWQAVTYGLVGDNYPDNKVILEKVDLQMIADQGYVAPGEDMIRKANGQDNIWMTPLNSYGRLLMHYEAYDGSDPQNHGQNTTGRYITINHQPQVSLSAIKPNDPFNHARPTVMFDESTAYMDTNFDLLNYVYMYDFEEYSWNYTLPITTTLPSDMRITFWHMGNEYELDEKWDVLKVPCNEDPDITSKIFGIQFKAYDSWEGESELSEMFYVKVENNDPWFEYNGVAKPNDYDIPGYLYTTVGISKNLYQGITWRDIEDEANDNCNGMLDMYWKLEDATMYNTGPFPFDVRGYYDVKYIYTDAHGIPVEINRKIEVNTKPTIMNNGLDPIYRQVDGLLDPWEDIVWADLDYEAHDIMEYPNGMTSMYYAVEKYNFLPGIDMFEPYSDSIDMSVRGRYMLEYAVYDPWGEPSKLQREVWVNEAPEIYVPDRFVLLNRGDDFDIDALVEVTDFEDDYLFDNNTLQDPIDYTPSIYVYRSEDGSQGTYITEIDTSISAIYHITYWTEDSMGGEDEEIVVLWVLDSPLVMIADPLVEMEVNGHFPVYNGVEVDFWYVDDLDPATPENGDTRYSFMAMLDGDPIGSLHQFTEVGTYEIQYVAMMEIWDDGMWHPFYNTLAVRTVEVVDDPMDDYIYLNDFMPMHRRMDSRDDNGHMIHDYDVYPVLIKYNPDTDHERLVSAFSMYNMMVGNDFDYLYGFDDIAVAPHPETGEDIIYALYDGYIFAFDMETSQLMPVINIFEELGMMYNMYIDSDTDVYDLFSINGLTVDGNGLLVVPIALDLFKAHMMSQASHIYDFENVLLYFDPFGVPIMHEENGTSNGYYRHLVGLGLINDDQTGDYVNARNGMPIAKYTDAAYSKDLSKLYLVGGYYMDNPHDVDGDFPDVDSYVLMSYIETEAVELEFPSWIPEDLLEILPDDFMLKFFNLNSQQGLMANYRYEGLATLDDDIFVSQYMDPIFAMAPTTGHTNHYYETNILRYQFGENNFSYKDMDGIDRMFMGALGAASKIMTDLSFVQERFQIFIGNNPSNILLVEFTEQVFPSDVYDSFTWEVESNESFIKDPDAILTDTDEDNDNKFLVDGTKTSDATVMISLSAMNKYSRRIETIYGYIDIDYRTAPPAAPAAPTPVIGVTLDTDAVTLAYGATVEEDLTSYDFTETVTGTANTAVTWELDDDTFVEVDLNGVVTAKDDVATGTGDIIVELTVRTVVGNATATATILFEEQTPLGAIDFFDPYIFGYSDNTFRPKNFVTRAEVATMFSKILKLNTDYPGSQKFNDVNNEHWAYDYIQAMFRTGIFVGYYDDQGKRIFSPNAPISRAEIAQVFSNYWKYLGISVTGENTALIPDVTSEFWASNAINRLYNTGIFSGYSDGSFKPFEPTLRDQIVTMINKLIARPANNADESKFDDILPSDDHYGDIEAASQTFLKSQGE